MEFLRELAGSLATFLRSYADWWGRAVTALCQEFDLDVPLEVSDFVGIILGSIVFVAFFRRLGWWDRKGDKPQPFPLKTTETPAEVLAKDREKQLAALVRVVLFLLLVALVATSSLPGSPGIVIVLMLLFFLAAWR
mgnify:CR=1 FL=1